MDSLIIDLRSISVSFGSRSVLNGLSLSVGKGELVIVEGATGAGKTTLIRLLLGALPVRSGSAGVLDADMTRASREELTRLRRRVGVVFQTPRFLERDSVLSNVILPLVIRGDNSARCRAEGTRALLEAGLSSCSRTCPRQISGGEQARLQIARALIHKPYLLLADEPFAHLDPESAVEAENLLATAHSRGMTVLITTHRPTRLIERARRYRLEGGRLVDNPETAAGASS
ncbi:ATP-binding cassette domain-containing protein [candidate division KSB1 bacterium]|nr:MAG: ATP-binding cassette domain-containing protein [candidate division KSB1 bacterium]